MKVSALKFLAVVVTLGILLTACGGGTVASKPVTASGFACPEPTNKETLTSKELNLFVWTEYIPKDMIECFELVYKVKVNRDEYSNNEQMLAKISKGNSSYDLVQPSNYIVQPMIRQKMIQKLDKTKLAVINNFDPQYMNLPFDRNNEYTLPYQAGTEAIVYNADKVKTAPTMWADLWKPEYKGRLVMLNDSRVVIGLTLIMLGYDPNTKDPKQLEDMKKKLAELVPNVKLFDSDSPKTALIGGDVDLGMTWTGEAVLAAREKPAIKYIYPKEGAIRWLDTYAIPTSAPHLDAVYAWLNYTNQPDVFWLMLRDYPYTNPNKAALDYAQKNQADIYKQYMDSPTTNTPLEALNNSKWLDDVGEALPLYDKIWTEVKGK